MQTSPTTVWRRVPAIVWLCLIADVGLCLLYIANHLAGQPSLKLSVLADLNGENSLAAWYSSTQLFGIAVLGAIFAHRKISADSRAILLAGLPLLFLLMSIDEAVQIHEWLGKKTDALLRGGREASAMSKTGIWMFVIGVPFLALFLGWAYSIKAWTADKPRCLWGMVAGMLLLLTGALGFEFASNWTSGVMYVLGVVAEELCEMVGATIILWAVYELALGGLTLQPIAAQPAENPRRALPSAAEVTRSTVSQT